MVSVVALVVVAEAEVDDMGSMAAHWAAASAEKLAVCLVEAVVIMAGGPVVVRAVVERVPRMSALPQYQLVKPPLELPADVPGSVNPTR
jgi:hypothetical protein